MYFRVYRRSAVYFSQGSMGKVEVFRCVECNEKAKELHRDYSNGILKITICVRNILSPIWTVVLKLLRVHWSP